MVLGDKSVEDRRGANAEARCAVQRSHEELTSQNHERDDEFPSLQTLNSTARIQQQVQERYKELEDVSENSKGTLDSFIEYVVKNSEKKSKDATKGMWPQDHVFVGTHRGKPTYEQLDECQWLLGFLRQRQVAKSMSIKENMIEYLIDLLQDAVDFSWPAAKGAHFVVNHRIINGLASWDDLSSVKKFRERFVKSTNSTNSTNSGSSNSNNGKFD